MTAGTPAQAAAVAFVTGCTARGITASAAAVPPEGKLDVVRELWADVAQAAVAAFIEAKKAEGKGDDRVWAFANGTKYSKEELIGRRLDGTGPAGVDAKTGVVHADRLRKDAEKNLKAKAKNAEAIKEKAKDAVL